MILNKFESYFKSAYLKEILNGCWLGRRGNEGIIVFCLIRLEDTKGDLQYGPWKEPYVSKCIFFSLRSYRSGFFRRFSMVFRGFYSFY